MTAPTEREVLDAAIAAAWPERWQKANDPTRPGASKRRNKLRKMWEYAEKVKAVRAAHAGACCANCQHYESVPNRDADRHCSLDSDFYGYMMTAPSDLCPRWKAAIAREGE